MRRSCAALALGLLADLLAPAQDPGEARIVVDRAIDAVGGTQKLSGLTGGVWKTNGTVRGKASKAEFHGELPGKFRIDSTRVVDGPPVKMSRIVDGDKGWIVEGDKTTPMTPAEIAGVRSSFYHKQAATTLIPLTEKGVQLAVMAKLVLPGGPATQIRVTRAGYPDLLMTFDDKSGLLVKSEMTDKDPKANGDRKVEIEWNEYKEFDGVKMASRSKTYHDGKLFIDTEITDFKRASGLPGTTFAPPPGK